MITGAPNNSSSAGDMAVIGEGTPNRLSVSIQVLQNIYHELTGKTEEVSKSYDEPYHIVLENFKQLNFRVNQAYEQYNVCSSNCSVTVFYINDTKDTFSSFERFEAFNAGSTSSVESVLLTYNFLVILPKLGQPQSYTVSVRVASPIAIHSARSEETAVVKKFLRMIGTSRTAVASVKYVDYAVARTILNTVDEWFGALPVSRTSNAWKIVRGNSDWIPLITRYFAGIGVAAIAVALAPHYLTVNPTFVVLAQFLLISFVSVFAAYRLAGHLGSAAEDSIDEWIDLSYICITDGDKKQVELARTRNRGAVTWGVIKFTCGLLVSVAAKLIANRLTS